jgi:AcrR family transcriptional regulator
VVAVSRSGTTPSGQRGRPAQSGLPEARRKQIVRAAYAVLIDKGYERTSIADIARHAQLGHGTVYRYFSGKRELLDHVFDYAVAKTVRALDLSALTEAEVSGFEQSLTLIDLFGWRLFTMIDDDPGILKLITVESSAIDPELRYRVVGMLSAMDAAMALLFDSVSPQWAQSAPADTRRTVGHMMLGMVGPGLVMSLTTESNTELRTSCLATVTAIADRGLLGEAESKSASAVDPGAHSTRTPAPRALTPTNPGSAVGSTVSDQPTDPAARRRAELYSAAWDLFLERGYRDVDVADITARATVSQGTFYNYFANKRAVLEAMMTEALAGVTAAMVDGLDVGAITTREQFAAEFGAFVRRVIAYIVARGPAMSFVALTAPGVDNEAFATALSGFAGLSSEVSVFLAAGRTRGWLRRDIDLDIGAQAVVSCLAAAVLPVLLDEGQYLDVEDTAGVCASYLMDGMRAAVLIEP